MTDGHEIWHVDAYWPVPINSVDRQHFHILLIQDSWRQPCWNMEDRHISTTGWSIDMKFGMETHVDPFNIVDR